MAGCWGALGTAPGRDGKGAGWQKGKSRRRAGPRAPDGPSGGSGAGVVRRRFSCWILSHRPCVASRGHSRGLGSRAPSGRGPASQPWGTHPVHPHVCTPYLPVLTPDVNAPPRGMTAPRPRRRPWPRHALSTCPGQAVRPSLGGRVSRACAVTQVGRRIPWGASLGSDPQTPRLSPAALYSAPQGSKATPTSTALRPGLAAAGGRGMCWPLGVPARPSCLTESVV